MAYDLASLVNSAQGIAQELGLEPADGRAAVVDEMNKSYGLRIPPMCGTITMAAEIYISNMVFSHKPFFVLYDLAKRTGRFDKSNGTFQFDPTPSLAFWKTENSEKLGIDGVRLKAA